jgi:hypothetical protein
MIPKVYSMSQPRAEIKVSRRRSMLKRNNEPNCLQKRQKERPQDCRQCGSNKSKKEKARCLKLLLYTVSISLPPPPATAIAGGVIETLQDQIYIHHKEVSPYELRPKVCVAKPFPKGRTHLATRKSGARVRCAAVQPTSLLKRKGPSGFGPPCKGRPPHQSSLAHRWNWLVSQSTPSTNDSAPW